MNPIWRNFLSTAGARFSGETDELLDFGQPLPLSDDKNVIVPLTHLSLIHASDEDAKGFLHGQFTSDINHLTPGKAQHAAWCSAKGRMQASFLIWRHAQGYTMTVAADLQAAIQKRLQMFVLRAKVKLIHGDESHALLGIAGPQAQQIIEQLDLPCPTATLTAAERDGIEVIHLDGQRYLLALPLAEAQNLWPKLADKAQPSGLAHWRWLDIQAAFPLVTLATKEEFVPQMADFEKIGGVSFNKGCYPGQEIVARTQYLGKVKRHLYRVHCAESLQAGDDLFSPDHPDQSCGMIMSAAPAPQGGFAALAVVQANYAANLRLKSLDGAALTATAVNP